MVKVNDSNIFTCFILFIFKYHDIDFFRSLSTLSYSLKRS